MDREKLEAYLAGELGEAERARLEETIAQDPEAFRELADQLSFDRALRVLLGDGDADRKVADSVAADLRGKSSGRFRTDVLGTLKAEKEPGAAPPPVSDSERPEVRFGTGIQRYVRARQTSSRRMAAASRKPRAGSPGGTWLAPALVAAVLLVAATLSLALFRRDPGRELSKGEKERRETAEQHRMAGEELARQDAALKKAKAEAGKGAAEKKAAEEKLAGIHAEQRRLDEARKKAAAEEQTAAQREAQRQEAARLEAERTAEEARIAQAVQAQEKAEREVAKAEEARKEAERRVAQIERRAEELGQIVFVADLKATGGAGPVLVRGGERLPLAKGAKLLRGDRIETEKPEMRNPKSEIPSPVHAALELGSGAVVDLADGSVLEILDAETSRLTGGLLYAEFSPAAGKGKFSVRTEHADVESDAGSFDLTANAKEAILQVAEGGAVFSNALGKRELRPQQKSVARKGFAPGAPEILAAGAVWRGRKAEPLAGPNLLADPGFEEGQLAWDKIYNHKLKANFGGRKVVRTGARSGQSALQVDGTGSKEVHQDVPAKAGSAYRVAGWQKFVAGKGAVAKVEVFWLNVDVQALRSDPANLPEMRTVQTAQLGARVIRRDEVALAIDAAGWVRFEDRFTAPAGSKSVRVRIEATLSSATDRLWMDDLYLGQIQ